MSALTASQVELLVRSCNGDPMWGGSTALEWLRRDVGLLCRLGFIEHLPTAGYVITPLGREASRLLPCGAGTSDTGGVDLAAGGAPHGT